MWSPRERSTLGIGAPGGGSENGRDRALAVRAGDCLAVLSAGAYCMSMASNYNTRGRAAELLVDGAKAHVIRRRESAADQMRQEQLVSS